MKSEVGKMYIMLLSEARDIERKHFPGFNLVTLKVISVANALFLI